MPQKKLKAGILGLNDKGIQIMNALNKSPYFELEAIADSDQEKSNKTAKDFNCRSYDDYRQFILQCELDCLVVTKSYHGLDEYLKMAMKKKFNILKLLPPAVNFEQFCEYFKLAEECNTTFCIANSLRFSESYSKLNQLIDEEQKKKALFVNAKITVPNRELEKWRTDVKLAGGGILLYDSYTAVDQIVTCFDLPDRVFALTTNKALDRKQRSFITEDTAVLNLSFNENLIGNIVCLTDGNKEKTELRIRTIDYVFEKIDGSIFVKNKDFELVEKIDFQSKTEENTLKMLENYALSLLEPENNSFKPTNKENLKNMALIESAYLSARTAMPEEPKRIFEIEKNEPGLLWRT